MKYWADWKYVCTHSFLVIPPVNLPSIRLFKIPSLLSPIRSPASVHQKQPFQTSEATRPPIRNTPSEHENKIYMNLTKIPIALAILDSYY